MCGQTLDFWDEQENFAIEKNELGYGTSYDGDKLDLHLCCGCMDRLIKACAVNPVTEKGC